MRSSTRFQIKLLVYTAAIFTVGIGVGSYYHALQSEAKLQLAEQVKIVKSDNKFSFPQLKANGWKQSRDEKGNIVYRQKYFMLQVTAKKEKKDE